MSTVSRKTVGRLSLYRRLLAAEAGQPSGHVYSHTLADRVGVTASQVRRDFMAIGYGGSTAKGYDVPLLLEHIAAFLDPPEAQNMGLAGVGNLGRALLAFFARRRPTLSVVAAFEKDASKSGRVILGCPCHPIGALPERVPELGITVGIIAVPADEAQTVADAFVNAGVCGLLNFAPIPLSVQSSVCVEDVDLTTLLDTVAFFARQSVAAAAIHRTEETTS